MAVVHPNCSMVSNLDPHLFGYDEKDNHVSHFATPRPWCSYDLSQLEIRLAVGLIWIDGLLHNTVHLASYMRGPRRLRITTDQDDWRPPSDCGTVVYEFPDLEVLSLITLGVRGRNQFVDAELIIDAPNLLHLQVLRDFNEEWCTSWNFPKLVTLQFLRDSGDDLQIAPFVGRHLSYIRTVSIPDTFIDSIATILTFTMDPPTTPALRTIRLAGTRACGHNERETMIGLVATALDCNPGLCIEWVNGCIWKNEMHHLLAVSSTVVPNLQQLAEHDGTFVDQEDIFGRFFTSYSNFNYL